MALSFAFGGNTGQSYDELQRRRLFAEALMQRGMGAQPKTPMEGLNSAASSILGALIQKKVGAQEAAGRAEYDKQRQSAFAGLIGQPQGGLPPANQPAGTPPVAPPDPNSPAAIGDQAMAALGKQSNNYKPGDRESFISAMMPHAVEASKMTGVDPRLIVAQAAQETGWGAHAPGNNFFGIKSHGQGGGNTMATTEYVNGQPVAVNDSFRGYANMRDSALGYANFLLENPRYQPMMNAQGIDAQLAALGQSGYATDPNYASSVGNIAKSLPDLMSLASNPYASDADRSVFSGLIQQALTPPDPMKAIELQKAQLELAQMQNPQGQTPEMVTQRLMLADLAGLKPGTPEYQNFMVTGNTIGRGANEFGLNPQVGRDKNGNPVLIQVGKDGTSVETKLPEGVTLDLSAKAEETARGAQIGKLTGQAMFDIPGAEATAALVTSQVDQILNDPNLSRLTGPLQGRLPNFSGGAQDFQARLDQLKGSVFLQAYTILKGGGQITEVEGQKAQNAMARLQEAQTEGAFRQALQEFKDAVSVGVNKMKAQSAVTTAPGVSSGVTYTYNPETGALE